MSRLRTMIELRKTLCLFVLLVACLLPLRGRAGTETPLKPLLDDTLSYFSSLVLKVEEVREGRIVISGEDLSKLRKGMRLKVFRTGKPFRHPVTREIVGTMEVGIGDVAIEEVAKERAVAKILKGDPRPGDEVRLGGTVIPMLFYQSPEVDFYLGDAYYRELKRTGRFKLIDAPIERFSLKDLRDMARDRGAKVILLLESGGTGEGETRLVERLYWVDGEEFVNRSVGIPDSYINELKAGFEFLQGEGNEPLLTYELPFSADHLMAADLDGDGKAEIILTIGGELAIYSYDVDLMILEDMKLRSTDMVVWLDAIDIDGKGGMELVLTSLIGEAGQERDRDEIVTETRVPDAIVSRVFRMTDGKLTETWKTDGFLRVIKGRLYHQDYSRTDIFTGPVREVLYREGFTMGDKVAEFDGPLYDFAPLADGKVLAVDHGNRLLVIDNGVVFWRDAEDLGGFIREYEGKSPTIMLEGKKWHINDRFTFFRNGVILPSRDPIVKKAKTIGYKTSRLLYVFEQDGLVQKRVLIDGIAGELLDYAIFGNKVAVLSKPKLGMKTGNILKGDNPFVKQLQIYSLSGR